MFAYMDCFQSVSWKIKIRVYRITFEKSFEGWVGVGGKWFANMGQLIGGPFVVRPVFDPYA